MTISPHHIKTSSISRTIAKRSGWHKLCKSKSPSTRSIRRAEEKKDNRIKGKLKLNLH